MNNEVQRKKINRFLKGKSKKDIDAFCIYQWIDRCHFEGWYDDAVALGSFIPPNSLNQDYQKRIEFLLGHCRNQINQRKSLFIAIGSSHEPQLFPIPKVFVDMAEELGLKLEGRGQNRLKLKYFDKRLLFLEKICFETCTFYFTDRSCDSLLTWLDSNGFDCLADRMRMTKKAADERRPRMKISWDEATSLLPILFTKEYLDEIKKTAAEKSRESSPSSKWNQFGHRIGSQAAKIDELLVEGASLTRIALAIDSTIGRVRSHIRHLEIDRGIIVRTTLIQGSRNNIYKIASETVPVSWHSTSPFKRREDLQMKFWSGFKQFTLENKSTFRTTRAYPKHWMDVGFGHTRCHICMTINTKSNLMTCELYINDSKNLFQKLLTNRVIIEQELGELLQWNELPDKKASRIKLIRKADLPNQENWNKYFTWLKDKAEDFINVFSKHL